MGIVGFCTGHAGSAYEHNGATLIKQRSMSTIIGRTTLVTAGVFLAGAALAALAITGCHAWAHTATWMHQGCTGHLTNSATVGAGASGSFFLVDVALITYLAKKTTLINKNIEYFGVSPSESSEKKTFSSARFTFSTQPQAISVDGVTRFKNSTLSLRALQVYGGREENCKIRMENYVDLNAGMAESQGIRDKMEDAHFAQTITLCGEEARLYGICDGHGGARASKYVAERFPLMLAEQSLTNIANLETVIPGVASSLNRELAENHELGRWSGTTLTGALVFANQIFVFNNGDSRTILVRNEETRQVTKDHSPGDRETASKLQQEGYTIHRPDRGPVRVGEQKYALASHIGGVSEDDLPCWTDVKILRKGADYEEGDTLVMACDGLFDVGTTREVGVAVRDARQAHKSNTEISAMLVDAAIVSGSTDNVSVMTTTL